MKFGSPIPLAFQLFDANTAKYVRVVLRDANDIAIGSPINLTQIGLGLYVDESVNMPSTPWVTAQYVVYDDSGYTIISLSEGAGMNVFLLDGPVALGFTFVTASITAIIENDLFGPPNNGLQDEIVKNSDRTFIIRLVRADNGEPFDLTGVTNIQAKFTNEDGTVLSINLTDGGAPITVVGAATSGKISVAITKGQSGSLMPMNPAPFSLVISIPSGQMVVNLPYQLAVFEEAV